MDRFIIPDSACVCQIISPISRKQKTFLGKTIYIFRKLYYTEYDMREDVRDIKKICPRCFATLGAGRVCPSCGKCADDLINPAPAIPVQAVIGSRYLIGEMLGAGGFGITYAGWDLSESKKVAIKEFFPKEYATRHEEDFRVNVTEHDLVVSFNHWLKAFIEEAKILMRIRDLHGVVKLSDFFEANNTAYIVTDYLEGPSLRTYLAARGNKIPIAEALGILRPVFESLILLHESGIIHKDISPENILIVQNKYVKLIDFGAASLYKRATDYRAFTVLKGGYSPIELYKPDGIQSPRTDVYELGATLYNCITGYIPALATEREQADTLPPPSKLGAELPEYVEHAIIKSLAVRPLNRYPTVRAFLDALT